MADLVGDRYELEQRLGHGGMATVHRAHDRKLGRQVAVKLLADNLVDDDVIRERFMREARLAAKLDHPNVVQVFDVGEDDGRPYIVMEYLDGGTLDDQLQRRRGLSRPQALGFLGQMCEGLGHAHHRKLVHRDVKPQNLLLRKSDACLKIADFGIARVAEETTRLTQPGKVIGTDSYMAPEQLADGKITAATDVYACGVVADQALPGARPPEMRAIIDRCLREDPRERFRDANALGKALKGVDGEVTATAVRPARTTRAPRRDERSTVFLPRTRGDGEVGTRRRFPDVRAGSRMALALLVAAIVVVGIILAAGSGGSSSSSPAPSGAGGSGSIQQSGDPAQQARALADYLRQQAR
jgi:tRNA A-37 threonylcarbamoyl transferase component Bud32